MAYPSYPETKEEWWRLVDENWANLYEIFYQFLPLHNCTDIDDNIIPHDLSVEITRLKETKDRKLARYFESAWWTAPDKSWIRSIPGWLLMCDLCSEKYVLYEEHENDQMED